MALRFGMQLPVHAYGPTVQVGDRAPDPPGLCESVELAKPARVLGIGPQSVPCLRLSGRLTSPVEPDKNRSRVLRLAARCPRGRDRRGRAQGVGSSRSKPR